MALYRIFWATLVKRILPFITLFLVLLFLFSCELKKQAVINNDFSKINIAASSLGWLDADNTLSALVKIEFITPDGYYPAKFALIVKNPSYLRLEMLPVIGVPDFLLTATPEKMNIFIPSRGELYSGRPTGSNLKKFLPWSMDIKDMIMIITGTVPGFQANNTVYQEFQEENNRRLEMKAPSGRSQIIWVGENNKLFKRVSKDEKGKELYNVTYIYKNDTGDFPEKIIIKPGDGNTSLSVIYADVKIEKSSDLSVFDLPVPDNVKSIILE